MGPSGFGHDGLCDHCNGGLWGRGNMGLWDLWAVDPSCCGNIGLWEQKPVGSLDSADTAVRPLGCGNIEL